MISSSFFFPKIVTIKTYYKINNNEILAIVKVFKTLKYYLKGCKYKIFMLRKYNNL